jgi:hypothetical protein
VDTLTSISVWTESHVAEAGAHGCSREVGMSMSRVRVNWSKNLTHDKSDLGEKSDPHSHPLEKFQSRTHQISVPIESVNGSVQFNIGC